VLTSLLAVQDCVYDWVASMGIAVASLNRLLHLSRYHSQVRDAAIRIEIQPVKIWTKDEGIRSAGNIAVRAHIVCQLPSRNLVDLAGGMPLISAPFEKLPRTES
jgi:hypothetical protein